MIDVHIIESNGLTALCTISGSPQEFREDLDRIKAIPYADRDFVDNVEPKYWRVRHAEKYQHIQEIKEAIQTHKRQMRFA